MRKTTWQPVVQTHFVLFFVPDEQFFKDGFSLSSQVALTRLFLSLSIHTFSLKEM